jgi:hypothetical protein
LEPDYTMTTRTFSFRKSALALTASAAIFATPALGQSAKPMPQPAAMTAALGVPQGECGAFGKYLLQEARDFSTSLSETFLVNSARFLRAGCKPFDKDGEIQIITRSEQDGISLGTALKRMDRFDIFKASGVKHCHRPQGGTCTITTGSNTAASPRG